MLGRSLFFIGVPGSFVLLPVVAWKVGFRGQTRVSIGLVLISCLMIASLLVKRHLL